MVNSILLVNLRGSFSNVSIVIMIDTLYNRTSFKMFKYLHKTQFEVSLPLHEKSGSNSGLLKYY